MRLPILAKNTRMKVVLKTAYGLIVLFLLLIGLRRVSLWYDYNRIGFDPLEVSVDMPRFYTEKRPLVSPIVQIVQEYPVEVDTKEEQAIVDMWGPYESQVALAIAQAESGMNCLAYNANTNGTIDVGLFQINSIHFDEDFNVRDATDCQKNIVKAYEIWEVQSWEPWVAFWTGSFRSHL